MISEPSRISHGGLMTHGPKLVVGVWVETLSHKVQYYQIVTYCNLE